MLKQARIADLLVRTGLNDRQIGDIIGVTQSTVWRLRHGRMAKVDKYIDALENHLGFRGADDSDAAMIADLVGYSRRVPALREALASLHTLMRESA